MKYYKITEIPVSENLLPYTTYKENELVQIECNSSFHLTKDLISYLGEIVPNTSPSFSIIYNYKNCFLDVIIKTSDNIKSSLIEKSLANVKWTNGNFDGHYVNLKNLWGSCNAFLMDKRNTNIIDDIIDTFNEENFIIEFIIQKINDDSCNEYLKQIELSIIEHSKEKFKNINVGENIFKEVWKGLKGGNHESFQKEQIKEEYKYILYKNDYLILKNAEGGVHYQLNVRVSAESKSILESISSKLKTFSEQITYPSRHKLKEKANYDDKKKIYTTSSQIASIAAFPVKEHPGFSTRVKVDFGQNVPIDENKRIIFSNLYTTSKTNLEVGIKLDDLVRHGFICGVTGSGKTSTIKILLYNAFMNKIPFLVIEPAKKEYQFFGRDINLDIYRLGIDNKFKMNPFAFPKGVHVQTHLDLLKSVFTAAFPMYGPMPYILETALLRIYQKRGWDLNSGLNIYQDVLDEEELFPTLKDLYNIIEVVSNDVGYSQDLTSDVKGALRVRIGSLMTGSKGKVLNTKEVLDLKKLLSIPGVLQLEQIGDNQEKNFLMGLILISIYEYYISNGEYANTLKHLLVVEEAHRLLENVPSIENNEIANMKGKSIETFTNILSEIRAYGQGILVADQIPNKLSPDVIKNTNLKIIHRLFAKDDREAVGHSIGLDDDQINDIIHLDQRQAIVFFDELDKPVKVEIKDASELLAEGKKAASLLKEVNNTSVSSLVQGNYKLQKETSILFNTMLIFPELQEAIKNELINLYNKFIPLDINEEDIIKLNKEFLSSYIEEKISTELINIVEGIELLKKINESENPFNEVIKYFENVLVNKGIFHPMDIYAPKYAVLNLILQGFNFDNIRNDILYTIIHYSQSQSNLARRIIIKSKMDYFININLLSNKQIDEIANGLMLILFKYETDILNYYFKVEDNTISDYQLKKVKTTESKANNELIKIKDEISRLTDVINQYLIKPSEKVASTHNEYNNKIINMVLIIMNIILIILLLLKNY